MGKLTLHGVTLSPFVRKVKILLIEKGIDHDHVMAPPSQDPEFLKISPLGKIPVLVDEEGRAINDSSAIVNYLEERFPQNSALPTDPYHRARARWFEAYSGSTFAPAIVFGIFGQRIVMPLLAGQPTDENVVKEAIESAPKFLNYLEQEIKGKEYFVNNTYSLADICVASNFINLQHADYEIDAEKYPELAKWYQSIVSREHYQQLIAGEKQALAGMQAKMQK
ncbi:glutathione S-transferase family protein [Candidatus Uabimicrobium amorphum]|uniref:Glutathione S-transferase n=1 Tax=Uabimicrobium amorphum TaxID=2596890 RepID=A0A5S9IRM0_UABAM|nr:glutathione S-transferase family protein [Candidatus Uabimicrobium amorphum]BBM86819.1 glutathione S-transferase [Candidatus Uabimicrobium amorphum]